MGIEYFTVILFPSCFSFCPSELQWTGTCIGHRNYTAFFVFVASLLGSTLFMVFGCVYVLLSWDQDPTLYSAPGSGQPWEVTVALILRIAVASPLMVWCLCALIFVGSLTFFHCYLCLMRRTTAEWIRSPPSHAAVLRQQWDRFTLAASAITLSLWACTSVCPLSPTQKRDAGCNEPMHRDLDVAASSSTQPPAIAPLLSAAWLSRKPNLLPMGQERSVLDDACQLELLLHNLAALNSRMTQQQKHFEIH